MHRLLLLLALTAACTGSADPKDSNDPDTDDTDPVVADTEVDPTDTEVDTDPDETDAVDTDVVDTDVVDTDVVDTDVVDTDHTDVDDTEVDDTDDTGSVDTDARPDGDGDGVPDVVDCAPTDPVIYQGAPELCDGIDNDCDSDTDEGMGLVSLQTPSGWQDLTSAAAGGTSGFPAPLAVPADSTLTFCPGTFYVAVTVASGGPVTVVGRSGKDVTFVDARGGGRAVDVAAGAEVTLRGLTLQGSGQAAPVGGAGLRLGLGAEVLVQDARLADCQHPSGGESAVAVPHQGVLTLQDTELTANDLHLDLIQPVVASQWTQTVTLLRTTVSGAVTRSALVDGTFVARESSWSGEASGIEVSGGTALFEDVSFANFPAASGGYAAINLRGDASATLRRVTMTDLGTAALSGSSTASSTLDDVTITRADLSTSGVSPVDFTGLGGFVATDLQITDCSGALSAGALNLGAGTPAICTDCIFRGNTGRPGAVSIYDADAVTLVRAVFEDNTSTHEGGGLTIHTGGITLDGAVFRRNEAAGKGGGLYAAETSYSARSTLTSCTFEDNTAGTEGGGLYGNGNVFTVVGGSFVGNDAATNGGGVRLRGLTGTDVSFTDNTASRGAGIFQTAGAVSLTGGELIRNVASALGGGLYFESWSAATLSLSGVDTGTGLDDNTPDDVYSPFGQVLSQSWSGVTTTDCDRYGCN